MNHARTADEAERYKVEPYVVAADVYSTAPHAGRGGWTWYTGSAGWMYRAGIEGILGLTRQGDTLHLDPSIPRDWPEMHATVTVGETRLHITVVNSGRTGHGVTGGDIDGSPIAHSGTGPLIVALAEGSHTLRVILVDAAAPSGHGQNAPEVD